MRLRLAVTVVALIVTTFSIGHTQSFSLESVDGLWGPDTLNVNEEITFSLRLANDANVHQATANGFRVFSPDGAEWDTLVGDTLPWGWSGYTPEEGWGMFDMFGITFFSTDGRLADTVGFGGTIMTWCEGMQPNFNEIAYTITIGPIDPIHHLKTIVLDSCYYPPTGYWMWAFETVDPFWDGPHELVIFDPDAPEEPSNLALSSDSLYFTSVEGDPSPLAQSFDVTSDKDPLAFTLQESSGWFSVNPATGLTPQLISVAVDASGMTEGVHVDSVMVTATEAGNSPLRVKVVYEVLPPPPTIGVFPSELVFVGVAGGENPSPKTLDIFNDGGQTLNWSLAYSESWLTVSPTSGTNDVQITASVDITGIAFGDYHDTLVIADPGATNSPVRVPVLLSIASDLPVLVVDSAFYTILVEETNPGIAPRTLYITNDVAGTMTYRFEEDSPRILSLTPSMGTAPAEVVIEFDHTAGTTGDEFYDTLWVYSDEAINSPQPVVFYFRFVYRAARMDFYWDPVSISVYECSMGTEILDGQEAFEVRNIGGDNPMDFKLVYESDYFTTLTDSGIAPATIELLPNYLGLPLGSYLDTITIISSNASNSPQQVVVSYDVIEGIYQPKIVLSGNTFYMTAQATEGQAVGPTLNVSNRSGGCMPWEFQDGPSWLRPTPPTGDVPEALQLDVDAVGMTLGTYADSVLLVAPDASNSPKKVWLELKVWMYRGDVNFDGRIDIADLVYLVKFAFYDGADPQPEWRVADVDCSGQVDVQDLLYMIDYTFYNGPPPCDVE